jgi:hypothetical protein
MWKRMTPAHGRSASPGRSRTASSETVHVAFTRSTGSSCSPVAFIACASCCSSEVSCSRVGPAGGFGLHPQTPPTSSSAPSAAPAASLSRDPRPSERAFIGSPST